MTNFSEAQDGYLTIISQRIKAIIPGVQDFRVTRNQPFPGHDWIVTSPTPAQVRVFISKELFDDLKDNPESTSSDYSTHLIAKLDSVIHRAVQTLQRA